MSVSVIRTIAVAALGIASFTACSGSGDPTGPKISSISITLPAGAFVVGKTAQLQAVVTGSDGAALPLVVKWVSSDPNIATIDQTGLVKAVAIGSARIEASAGGVTGSKSMEVLPIRLKAVSAGSNQTCGITIQGDAFCWGADAFGTLGAGNPPPVTDKCSDDKICTWRPIPVAGGHIFTSLSAHGSTNTCAIASDGVWCWGLGAAGEIGDGLDNVVNAAPTKVQTQSAYTSVSVGFDHTCALTTSNDVNCWGSNTRRQLGSPQHVEECPKTNFGGVPIQCAKAPIPVSTSLKFDKISAGTWRTCGLAQDGKTYCWGDTDALPVVVTSGVRFTDISVGSVACAIGTDSHAYCWGSAAQGNSSLQVVSSVSFAKIFAGNGTTCALDVAGAAYCWGNNSEGQIGDGTTTSRATPVLVGNGIQFSTLSLGDFHTCGIGTDGFTYCWGRNNWKQLGNQRDGNILTPTLIAGQ